MMRSGLNTQPARERRKAMRDMVYVGALRMSYGILAEAQPAVGDNAKIFDAIVASYDPGAGNDPSNKRWSGTLGTLGSRIAFRAT